MKSYFQSTNTKKRFVSFNPSICPICNSKISPIEMYSFDNDISGNLTRTYSCPACGKGFISHFDVSSERDYYQGEYYYQTHYIGSFPNYPSVREFNDSIQSVSKSFCDIYNQALAAESYGLNEISGIAYRKALEFLIKDYCIYRYPDDADAIMSKPLSQVINDYVDSDKIKNNSKAATWIGNDETHYIRKFEDKDINDLKKFIEATLAFITYDIISDKAEEFINSN